MKLIIDIDEDVRIAISRMGLLRIPDEMQKKVDKAIQHGTSLDKIYADIQKLRGCSCSCSDGIIDDVEDILDKYKAEIAPQESEE